MHYLKFLKNFKGWIIIVFLSIFPIIIWLFEESVFEKFRNFNVSLISAGQTFGLAGMAMFSVVIILSVRLKAFEKIFWGINESYVAHHILGGIAFCFILFHPILLALRYVNFSFRQAALFLLPSNFWPQNFGIIAILIMVTSLCITFYLKSYFKYQTWRFTHKFLGVAYIFAFFHSFLMKSDIEGNPFLKFYMFFLGITAISAFIYRSLAGAFLVKKYRYIVADTQEIGDATTQVKLIPFSEQINFVPGQFVFLKFYSKEVTREIHPFSISSAPGSQLEISVKNLGDYTKNIKNLKKGDTAVLEGPFGKFSFKSYNNKKQIWVAGGIGITPFLSMMRSLKGDIQGYDITLFYSAKEENGFILKKEMEKVFQESEKFKLVFWRSNINGPITGEAIARDLPDFLERDILICGPVGMMSSLKSQFLKLGIKRSQLHTEEFQL